MERNFPHQHSLCVNKNMYNKNKKIDPKKISNEIKKNGYCIIENFIPPKKINQIKNSFLNTLNYIKNNKEKNLQKKYYQIKKFNSQLKGNWFDIISLDTNVLHFLYSDKIINIVKKYFKTSVVFSGRRHVNVFDDANDKLLNPHQETHQIARDTIVLWAPLYDTGKLKGGLTVYKNSHKYGYFKHVKEKIKTLDKKWTKSYNHVEKRISSKFEKIDLNIKAGSVLLMNSKVLHCSYPTKKKGYVRMVLTERYSPLKKIPFLRDPNAPLNIPFVGVDYNKIRD